jgi:hypothetical protein
MDLVTPAKVNPQAASDLCRRASVLARDTAALLPEVRDATAAVRKQLGIPRSKVADATDGHVTVARLQAMEGDDPALPTLREAVALARWLNQLAGGETPKLDGDAEAAEPEDPEA